MSFVRVWLTGYYSPVRMIEQLRSKPAPQWGFYGVFLRAALDSLLLFLPLALVGRIPSEPSNLAFLPTEQYYWHLIWLSPIVFGAQWLLWSALSHVVLGLTGQRSDVDQILNIYGMSAIVVGAFLIVWGWVLFALGDANPYVFGVSHLIIVLWSVAIQTIGLKRRLGVPLWPGAILSFLDIPLSMPFGIMFMRSPF
jgi:hypothetical protein